MKLTVAKSLRAEGTLAAPPWVSLVQLTARGPVTLNMESTISPILWMEIRGMGAPLSPVTLLVI